MRWRSGCKGEDSGGRSIERRIALVTDYDGPATPSSAALSWRKILHSGPPRIGAFPCVGLLSLDELLAPPAIRWGSGVPWR